MTKADDTTATPPATESATAASQQVDDLADALSSRLQVEDNKQRDDNIWKTAPVALRQFAEWIQDGTVKRILVVAGAGVSVAAGIPDFRTPGTGLYDNLQKYNLPYPEAVFDVSFYATNPKPFCQLAQELWPGKLDGPVPTLTHSFLALLAEKQLLLRTYTQNIDGLEHLANIPEDLTIECHGHFRSASCIKCRKAAPDMKVVQQTIVEKGEVPICTFCINDDKKWKNRFTRPIPGYIKPDIVFFGEGLPDRFHRLLRQDLYKADCCLVLGTSLQVAPVSHIPQMVPRNCKRVLLNRELVGSFHIEKKTTKSTRDLFHEGDCDDSIVTLAELLGWKEELLEANEKAKKALRK